jgi:hypothetical protein
LSSISSSDHCRVLAVTAKEGFIYTSNDYGNNWTLKLPSQVSSTTLTTSIPDNVTISINVASASSINLTKGLERNRFLLIEIYILTYQKLIFLFLLTL